MRTITAKHITDAVARAVHAAAIELRPDVLAALKKAYAREKEPRAKETVEIIIENAVLAKKNKVPICQDTGMSVVYCDIGRDVRLKCDIEKAITEGIKKGTRAGALRRSIVKDPLLERVNTGTNTPAIIHYRFRRGERLKVSILLKGFGCENKGQVVMLNPTASVSQITSHIVRIVKEAGANACPPFIVGVGIGGTMDTACALAKEALLQKVGARHKKKHYSALETDLLKKINALNIGPLGLSGKTTALDVKIKEYPTHIAGLPVAVNISCHALRSKTIII
jgi:fumarate hydratase subunit alpha